MRGHYTSASACFAMISSFSFKRTRLKPEGFSAQPQASGIRAAASLRKGTTAGWSFRLFLERNCSNSQRIRKNRLQDISGRIFEKRDFEIGIGFSWDNRPLHVGDVESKDKV